MKRWGKRLALACGVGVCGSVVDDSLCYGVVRRSLRAAGTGLYLLYQYKVIWTPENASEVHERVAQSIVACCKANEGMYVKFGQQMTTLGHVLPEEYPRVLGELLDDASTYDGEAMKGVVEKALGRPIDEIFASFDVVPVASASVAQVHKAVLLNGDPVAVKIQKPPVSFQNGIDFKMLHVLLYCLETAFSIPMLWSYQYTVDRYNSELDFVKEAENALLAKQHLSTHNPSIYVPVPYTAPGMIANNVLITEWVDGMVRIDDTDGLRALGADPSSIVATAVGMYAHSIFETGHVHCDPHPGNLLVRRKDGALELVLIDHGLYVTLDDQLRQEYALFWCSMVLTDKKALWDVCSKWGISDPELFASLTQMKPYKVKRGTDQMLKKGQGPGLTKADLARIQLKLVEKLQTILEDTSRYPKELLFVGRALNYLRSHNWAHGSIVNRVQILGVSAARGLPVFSRLRFHATLYLLRALEAFKATFPTVWHILLPLLPSRVSAPLSRFGSILDAPDPLPASA